MAAFQEVLNRMLGIQTNAQQNLPVMPNNGNPAGAYNMPSTGGNAPAQPAPTAQTGGPAQPSLAVPMPKPNPNQPPWMNSSRINEIWQHLLNRRRGGGYTPQDQGPVAMPNPQFGGAGPAIPMPKPVLRPEVADQDQRYMERPDRPVLPNRYFRDYER